jgi:xylan 1,4-beta-xylosidase
MNAHAIVRRGAASILIFTQVVGAAGVMCRSLYAQQVVTISVDANAKLGHFKPIYAYFGGDEPNFTYMKNGRKLVAELGKLSPAPVYIRTHNLLTSGDGTPALKWGSTNAYTEEASGKPIYDWTIVDRILDSYVQVKAKAFVEIGFMPEALSTNPQPYQHHWHPGARYDEIFTGWSYPPKDYDKWAELVRHWVLHSVERYGKAEVLSWYWELWNEPDIPYWRGTPEEYNKLYDFTVDAVKRALPPARVGGPATTGPSAAKAAAFLRQFLEHCARGKNYVTGRPGTPLDFISFHAKGSPRVVQDHVQMGIAKNLQDVEKGLEVVSEFPQFRGLPIFLTESDPEGCAACSARTSPQNAYRNGPLYPCYVAAALGNMLKLADRHHGNLAGMLTWAFEFEDQPWFEGFRTLATNGVAKPVLNVFRMAGLMRGDLVRVESTGTAGLDAILRNGVRDNPDIDALATRSDRQVAVMVWNYRDDDISGPDAPVTLLITGLAASVERVLLRHYRIDNYHSNAFTVWKRLGSPQNPSPEQYAELESAGQLELLNSPEWVWNQNGKIELRLRLPVQSVSLIELTW